jgi:sortase (surface protein transpeptidase)
MYNNFIIQYNQQGIYSRITNVFNISYMPRNSHQIHGHHSEPSSMTFLKTAEVETCDILNTFVIHE